jgi:hypothetical protein
MSITPEKLGEFVAKEACKSSSFSAKVDDLARSIEDQIFNLASDFRGMVEKELGIKWDQDIDDDLEKYAEYGMTFEGEIRNRIAESIANIFRGRF